MKVSKLIIAACSLVFILSAGCKGQVTPETGNGGGGLDDLTPIDGSILPDEAFATESKGERATDLDFIFNNMTLGTTTLKMRRSEWNQMLRNFDYFYKNENLVKVENYTYEKDGETWNLQNCGIRLRGNTSRYKPQGKSKPTDETGHTMPNAQWDSGFYSYAATCPDSDYRQAHFKVDFEPEDGQEQKMANCMKGVALKRNDCTYSRELLCYDIFRRNGIWAAPRASHTRVLFQFIEDLDSDGKRKEDVSECTVTNVDFGVYEMFEEVNKQSLKARSSGEITGKSIWKNNKGDLWKCAGGNLADSSASMFAEDIRITDFDETKEPKEPKAYIYNSPTYDLKTNKDQVERASKYLKNFINELGALKNTEKGTAEGTRARRIFYEKWFDVDLFIKTYAINISVGMDDDYWGNANNYYLYFDNSEKGTQKCTFIPFDYDNTLGNSISGTGAEKNVFAWGKGEDRPLIDRLLEVPEYLEKYKNYLLSVTEYNNEKCPSNNVRVKQMFEHWQDLVAQYCCPTDLQHTGSTSPSALWRSDNGGYNATKYYLSHEPYYFEQMHSNIIEWSKKLSEENTSGPLSIYELKSGMEGYDGGYEGIQIGIKNIPENAAIRRLYLNDKKVYEKGFYSEGSAIVIAPEVTSYILKYPYVKENETYSVKLAYANSSYNEFEKSGTLSIKAPSGKGEFVVSNNPAYTITGNKLNFSILPEFTVNGVSFTDGYYVLELTTENWNYQSWNRLDDNSKLQGFNLGEHVKAGINPGQKLKFSLRYVMKNDDRFFRYVYDESQTLFTLE